MSKAKRHTLLYLLAGGILTAILAMSLSNLALAPGKALSIAPPRFISPSAYGSLPGTDLIILAARGILALTLILLPVVIVYSLFTREGRRRLVTCFMILVVVLLLANYLQSRSKTAERDASRQIGLDANALFGSLSANANGIPPFPASPPTWLTVAIVVAASVAISVTTLWAVRLARQREKPPASALEQLAEQAQNALDELGTGADFRATVIRCYHEMTGIVKQEKGISRESAMTPREFEERLVDQGLPREGVRTLTRLFERVRYGNVRASDGEEALAVSCLADIASACQKYGGRA